jgi:uncharacterized glyoxalase superfamily protein PhnB
MDRSGEQSSAMTRPPVLTEVRPRLVVDRVDDAIAFHREGVAPKLMERFVDTDGVIVDAAVRVGQSVGSLAEEMKSWQLPGPAAILGSPVLLHLTVAEPDTVCTRMAERGGAVVIPIKERPYGKREGRARDSFGHLWALSRADRTHCREDSRALADLVRVEENR